MILLRTTLLSFCLCMVGLSAFSQNVTILPGGITPAQSGSYPRLSYDDIAALTSPQDGDIAYDVTFKCMRLYNGTKWVRLISDDDLNIPSMTAWSAGGKAGDGGLSVAVDTSGNIFVTGYFRDTANFNGTTVISAGYMDIFIAKYSNTGLLQWIQSAGGASEDSGLELAVDIQGNVYVTGYFQATANFSGTSLTSAGSGGHADTFVAKYSADGTFLWVQQGGGSEVDVSNSIAVDSGGDIYITGYFYATATFGSSSVTSSGSSDVFIAKYNTDGVLQWLQKIGNNYTDVGTKITLDQSGKVYITGYFHLSTLIGSSTLTSAGGIDIFVAKFDPVTSTWLWAQRAGGLTNDSGTGIVADVAGNVYATGYFAETATFGSTTVVGAGHWDIFLAKYDINGNLLWVTNAGGANDDLSYGIAIDADENVYLTGNFSETATFGSIALTSAGDNELFIAKYNKAGVVQWVQRAGNVSGEQGSEIIVDARNNIYVTGYIKLKVKFGSTILTSAGGTDIFIARIKE